MKIVLVSLAIFAIAQGAVLPNQATYGLKEDFDRFVALLPREEIVGIVFDYLANDAQVQDAFEYIQSDDFKALVLDIESIPQYKDFLKYLQENGLNVFYYIQKLHDFLELPPFNPRGAVSRGSGVRGLIDDIEAILPLDEIKSLYYELLETSPAFQNLMSVLKSDNFKTIVEKLRADSKFQQLIQRAKDHGVDVALIVELLNKIFGWGIETRIPSTFSLHDDFEDFMKLIPGEQIVGIVVDYLANDEQVQEVFEFIQSDDFKNLVVTVDAVPEYIQFLNYLQNSGLDVYRIVNEFHKFLGLKPLPAPQRSEVIRGLGIRGLLDDIEAILPLARIRALYYEKLQTSPDFKNLVDTVKSDEFKGLIERLRANPTFRDIVKRAEAHGIDVKAIIDFFNRVLGWDL